MIFLMAIASMLILAPAEKPLPTNEARSGAFYAVQLSFDDPDRFEREWGVKTEGAHLSTTTVAYRNKPIFVTAILAGCAADAQGNCDVTADIKVIDPNGSVYAEHQGVEAWRARQPPAERLVLSAARLGIVIEAGEPLGVYRIRLTLHDNVSKRDLITAGTIDVREATKTI